MPTLICACVLGLFFGCASPSVDTASEATEPVEPSVEPSVEPEETATAPSDVPSQFGQPISERERVALSDITAAPEQFDGQVVSTEGEITAVCQRMGCWMEMKDGDGPAVRVPMAGHAFFLPKDVSGRRARVEGHVALRTLPPGEAAHLASEGAQAIGQRLQITATGVELL